MSAGSATSGSNTAILPMHDKTPLSHLLELAVQKTYHELYTMADVYVFFLINCNSHSINLFCFSLPSKTNLER